MDLTAGGYTLHNVGDINVILGKNGSGKSTLLKEVEQHLQAEGLRKYVTPERGGELLYAPNVEQNLTENPQWLGNSRRKNQFEQFRQQSVVQFRRLELAVFRASEGKEIAHFDPYVERLNSLLDNVEMRRVDPTFKIFDKHDGDVIQNGLVSSGEAELISLGIEAFVFAEEAVEGQENYLFFDEPDVHLHPDLQGRLMEFLASLVDEGSFKVFIATHSTAILGALSSVDNATVAFLQPREREITFESIGEIHRRVLPIFGAHPLSNVFNEAPILIVEGEDDERVWQQAVRTANGATKLYPVACDGIDGMNAYEQEVGRIINAVYDNAVGYSLRDRDGGDGEINDQPPVIRMKLACRAVENLILSDDVLASCGMTWDEAQATIEQWIANNASHPKYAEMVAFRDSGYKRKSADLKQIRTVLVGMILNSTKSWEVLVGIAIGRLEPQGSGVEIPADSLQAYLGPKAVAHLLCFESK